MKRRKIIKGLIGLAGAGVLAGLYTWQVEPFWLEFVHQKMPVKNLPKELEGKTLMQISDMHVGNRFNWKYIVKSLEKAKAFKPDFVVYTGDFVSYEDSKQFSQLQEVLKSTVKGQLGTFGVLGNHDYGDNWAQKEVANEIVGLLDKAGVTVLRNGQQEAEGLNFIGFDDYWSPNFKTQNVMANYDNSKANIVLCHNPDVADLDVWNNYKGWILSGHTHGGQCKPPFLPPPMLPVKNRNYTAGTIDLKDGRYMYINRALGHLWQVRFNVRPEITVFELTALS